jgi:predicted RNase H-like HicB family nuclease
MHIINLPVEITWEEDVYIARCPDIQGAFAVGESPEESLRELISVVEMIKEYREEDVKKYGQSVSKIFTSLPIHTNAQGI